MIVCPVLWKYITLLYIPTCKNFSYFTKELEKKKMQANLLVMHNYINVSPERFDLYFYRKSTIQFDFYFC